MSEARAAQVQRGLNLEYITIAYNSLEGLIAIMFGIFAGSIALTRHSRNQTGFRL